MRTVLKGPAGLRLILDSSEIFPNDPGQGTPAIVELTNGDTATYNCAVGEGETNDGTPLTLEQVEWLNSKEDAVEKFLRTNRP